jgi:hypothetical protein
MTVPEHFKTACDLRERFRALRDRDYHYTAYHQHVWDNTHEQIVSTKMPVLQLETI